jgi:hypothetical protein
VADRSFLTSHAPVVLCIARDPGVRLRYIAARTGVTERTARQARQCRAGDRGCGRRRALIWLAHPGLGSALKLPVARQHAPPAVKPGIVAGS